MISLGTRHARLEIPAQESFGEVSESIRMLFQLCRVNGLPGAMIVSLQGATDWRSCMRLGIRFAAVRSMLPHSRLALVAQNTQSRQRGDVCEVAHEAGLTCQVFEQEENALAWLDEDRPGLRVVPA